MTVSAIIVNTNEGHVLFDCLQALDASGRPQETIVVDNSSTDGSPERVEAEYPWVRLIRSGGNLGYAGANNLGARHASGEILAILNPDAFVTPGWLEPLCAAFSDPSVAVVGPKIYRGRPGAASTFDSAGGAIEYPLGEAPARGYLAQDVGQFDVPAEVAYCSGAALAVRRSAYERLGGFVELLWCYYEETDLCWRARLLGLRCVYEPRSLVYHLGSVTFGQVSPRKVYFQTRNRILVNVQNLAWYNALLFGALELVQGACVIPATALLPQYREFSLSYLRAWGDALKMLPVFLKRRAEVQKMRVVPDRKLLELHERVGLLATFARYARLVLFRKKLLFAPGRM